MDIENKNSDFLKNHVEKCRCCFTEFKTRKERSKITKKIKIQFFCLIQLELNSEEHFSNHICGSCKGKLESFQDFKQDIISKQQELIELVDKDQYSIEFLDYEYTEIIKEEPNTEKSTIVEIQQINEEQIRHGTKIPTKTTKREGKSKKSECAQEPKAAKTPTAHLTVSHQENECLSCDICSYTTKFFSKISRHVRRHIKRNIKGTFVCYICGITSSTQPILNHHIRYCHEIIEKAHICYCGKKYKRKSGLLQHTNMFHKKKKRTHCEICDKSFATYYFKLHMKTHETSREKKYSCQVCSKTFTLENLLKSHQKLHAEPEIPCKDENCTKLFATHSNASRHYRREHLCETVACEFCGKVISSLTYRRHVRELHKGYEKVECGVLGCTSAFLRRDNYRGHVKKAHANYLQELTKDELAAILNRAEFKV